MYKGGIFYLVPILHLFIPITLGLVTGFICEKFTYTKTIYSIIISIVVCIVYLAIITFYTSSKNEAQLFIILFVWNSILIFISNKIYLHVHKRRNV